MHKITKEQQRALYAVYLRKPERERYFQSYLRFRRTAFLAFGDCLMVPWFGMVLGIEVDGHTHS